MCPGERQDMNRILEVLKHTLFVYQLTQNQKPLILTPLTPIAKFMHSLFTDVILQSRYPKGHMRL